MHPLWIKILKVGRDKFFQLISVSVSLCILRPASLFRSYSESLPTILNLNAVQFYVD